VPALERVAASDSRPSEPLDEHIVAFIAANHQGLSDVAVTTLTRRSGTDRSVLDMVELLSGLQRAFGPPEVPRLAEWLSASIGPVLETYHNHETRRRIETAVDGLVPEGSLNRLLCAIDDHTLRQGDKEGFARAQKQFLRLTIFRHWIESGGHGDPQFIGGVAHPIGSAVTAVVGAVAVLVMTVLYL
jgi:hypothetical protein